MLEIFSGKKNDILITFAHNRDSGYKLEPHQQARQGDSNGPEIYYLIKNKKHINFFLLKFFYFYNLRKICILHGCVFIMPDDTFRERLL